MRTLLASLVLGLALWSASPAGAQLELDPCLDNPVQCAEDTVDDVAGDAIDELEETVDEITGTVDDVTDPVDDIVNPPGGTGPAPATGPSQQAGGSSPRPATRANDSGPAGSGPPAPAGTARPGTGARRVERPSAQSPVPPPSGDALDRIRQTLSGSTDTLAFPLALMLVVGVFLLLQGRVDRSDPKLALAPVDPDEEILAFG